MDSENLLNVVFSGFFATLRMTIKVVAPFVLLFQGELPKAEEFESVR